MTQTFTNCLKRIIYDLFRLLNMREYKNFLHSHRNYSDLRFIHNRNSVILKFSFFIIISSALWIWHLHFHIGIR